ncbi:MAG: lipopolysaccharide heptosyltransferase I [Desulfuromonadales bacterium]|nr:lipopolysaccharide heptosyltransferase I [Desulfuromonadales bacterium]
MKILIVKVSALGDVVHALPVLAYLKSADPDMQIDWLVEQSFSPFLDDHPMIDNLYRIDTRAWRKSGVKASLHGALSIIRDVRKSRYDCVLDLQGNAKSAMFTLSSGAPLRFGFDRGGVRESLNLLATNRKVPLSANDYHVTDRSIAIARTAFPDGTEIINAGPLPVSVAAAMQVVQKLNAENFSGSPLVVLHYGTTWVTKHWPLISWQALANKLIDELGIKPVLTWGNDQELSAVQSIQRACNNRALVWPRGSLKDLTALLAKADLVVGSDTGPIHIAAAVGTSTVSIFRVTDPKRNAPRGSNHSHVSTAMDCSACLRKTCELDTECGLSIPVDTVFDMVKAHLSSAERV